ncbi:molecular chaperone HtpG [Planctomycetota bacterium]
MSKHEFQTEVSQLLHLIIHSLYSHKEIFLRELVSNASDALDKMKYLTLTDDDFKSLPFDPKVEISFEEGDQKILTVKDSGIGMNEEELVENLGMIARSGTKSFLAQMTGDTQADASLIGQFGVGFYSCFMVADKVEVISRKAGEDKAFRWTSDGKGAYEITEAQRDSFGTDVVLYLSKAGEEYANRWQIENLVKKYSNHIAFPIFLHYLHTEYVSEEDKKNGKEEKTEAKTDQINAASALWKRPKSELKEEDYQEFYKTIAHDYENPLFYLHTKAEGTQEYTTLFYVPQKAPHDLFHADYKAGVKLYVKRVFITDDEKDLLPPYLRFVRGIIDSEDLPLNVSREILQQNDVLAGIKKASVSKLLSEFAKLAKNDADTFQTFIEQFNRPLKEGLYSDYENRDELLELVRYKSSKEEGYTSLAAYQERMQDEQKAIYYITGGKEDTLRNSPLLETYRDKDIEVLIMDDEIDEIVIQSIPKYKDLDLKAVNKSGTAEDLKTESDKDKEKEVQPLMKKIKKVLGDRVKDVVASTRLSDSPSCIVADDKDPTMQMQQMLKAMGQADGMDIKPILEVNPTHPIVTKLKEKQKNKAVLEDVSFLLLEQAMLVEGAEIKKPADLVKRLNRIMEMAL